jgi:hypothetical protein
LRSCFIATSDCRRANSALFFAPERVAAPPRIDSPDAIARRRSRAAECL